MRGRVESMLRDNVDCAYEIVIDGIDESSVALAMAEGIRAACGHKTVSIGAGNYGGKLGKYHFHLHDVL